MAQNRIWIGQDANVEVYRADKNKNRLAADGIAPWTPIDGPLFTYCYLQNTTLSSTVPSTRRPVTGRPKTRLLLQAYEYELDVSHFYLTKAIELDLNRVFNREQWLELVLQLTATENANVQEPHTFKRCKATNFTIAERDNENINGTVKFLAEEFV